MQRWLYLSTLVSKSPIKHSILLQIHTVVNKTLIDLVVYTLFLGANLAKQLVSRKRFSYGSQLSCFKTPSNS